MEPKSLKFTAAFITLASLAAFSLAVQNSSAGQKSSASEGLQTKIETKGDGNATVTFHAGDAKKVDIYNSAGEKLGDLDWQAGFSLDVKESAIRSATTAQGIDLKPLLRGLNPKMVDGKMLLAAQMPNTVISEDGTEIPKGTIVYFGLDRLVKEEALAPVAAFGGKSMGPGGAANEFNDRLMNKGMKGEKKPAPETAQDSAAEEKPHTHAPTRVHSTPNVALNDTADDSDLDALGMRFLSAPMCSIKKGNDAKMTSYWGRRRSFQTSNGQWATSWHDGLDISAKKGTPVLAAADGCVVMKPGAMTFNRTRAYGLSLVLEHAKGLSTQYAHMDNFSGELAEFARGARKGDKYCVKRGDQIGFVGRTGNCTGNHLHFGVRQNGKSVDPRRYMVARSNADLTKSCTDAIEIKKSFAEFDKSIATPETTRVSSGATSGAAIAR